MGHQILPLTIFGNRRASRLKDADLLEEFAHYESQIRKMLSFAVGINFAITSRNRRRGRVIWPKRPQLQLRPHQAFAKASRHHSV
jgi:hypothetical protein